MRAPLSKRRTAAICAMAIAGAAAARDQDFIDLADLCEDHTLDPIEWVQGSVTATRYYQYSPDQLVDNRAWFKQARSSGEAAVSGLYVAIHGGLEDLGAMRSELERNPAKRKWLQDSVGTEARVKDTLDTGRGWVPLIRLLPRTEGIRTLAQLCVRSKDPLVRRSGALWGFWFHDASYPSQLRQMAQSDPDPVTRQVTALLYRERAREGRD